VLNYSHAPLIAKLLRLVFDTAALHSNQDTSEFCPGGTLENSPAFQRREQRQNQMSPAGTTEDWISAVPSGLDARHIQTRR
jgi:hypothetical protein